MEAAGCERWAAVLAAAAGLTTAVAADEAAAGAPVWCHVVRPGESLAAVARRTGTSQGRLRQLNGLERGAPIRRGDVLVLPAVERLRSQRLASFAAIMPASRGNLVRENARADADGLSRLRTRATLDRFVHGGLLVPVPESGRGFFVIGVPDGGEWRARGRACSCTNWARPCTRCSGAACASPT